MSQCLEVSCLPGTSHSTELVFPWEFILLSSLAFKDGSAMFINRRAYRLVSSQQFAYATSDSDDGSEEYYSENKVCVFQSPLFIHQNVIEIYVHQHETGNVGGETRAEVSPKKAAEPGRMSVYSGASNNFRRTTHTYSHDSSKSGQNYEL